MNRGRFLRENTKHFTTVLQWNLYITKSSILIKSNDFLVPASNFKIYGKEHRYITKARYIEQFLPVSWHLIGYIEFPL